MSGFTGSVTVYYWPMLGRAGATIRMLEHAGVSYTVKSEFPDIAGVGSAFGCTKYDTFAPPVVQDGDFMISQSTACAAYVGEKCGLAAPNVVKGYQHLNDIVDVFEGGIGGSVSKGGAELKKYLEGDRIVKLLGNLERGITGPFYYGDKPTTTDFFLCQHVDWNEETLLNRLKAEKGVDIFASFPKLYGVVKGIRNLESYKNYKARVTVIEDYKCKDEVFAQYA